MEKNQYPMDLNQQGTEKIQHPSDSITNGTDETPYLPYRKPYPSDETPDQKINLLYKSIIFTVIYFESIYITNSIKYSSYQNTLKVMFIFLRLSFK